jgi:hypothetical protein
MRRDRHGVYLSIAVIAILTVTLLGSAVTLSGGASLRLGLAGPYPPGSLVAAHQAGVRDLLVEVEWRYAEPVQGHLDAGYLAGKVKQITDLRAEGFHITLNAGIQDAPDWLLEKPGARFVNQFGSSYTDSPVPNLVYGTEYRPVAESYLARLLQKLGAGISLIRAGGGPQGELGYPWLRGPGDQVMNYYWAFDKNAERVNPVPGWRPGSASPNGEARKFLNWYLDALVDYQNWQVRALRAAGYRNAVAVLYPSSGIRPGDAERAIADNLGGTSSAEQNGEIQRGYDFARQIRALSHDGTVVYGTWGENGEVIDYLVQLATLTGHPVMAENSGGNTQAELDRALRHAAERGLAAFYLIRATDLTCNCRGHATFLEVARIYKSLDNPTRAPPGAS